MVQLLNNIINILIYFSKTVLVYVSKKYLRLFILKKLSLKAKHIYIYLNNYIINVSIYTVLVYVIKLVN